MGSQTADTLKEIREIRGRLDARLREIERRLPPLVERGRTAARVLGGGVGTGIALFVARRVARRAKGKRRAPASDPPAVAAPQVVVRNAVGWPVLGAAAIWAAVRVYESRQRQPQDEADRTPALRPIPAGRRA